MRYYAVMLSFANKTGKMLTDDEFKDIDEALAYASHNLALRYHSFMSVAERFDEYTIKTILKTDDMHINSNSIPRHLKGVATYMLKKWPEKYEKYKSGTRLFYIDVACDDTNTLYEEVNNFITD